MAVVVVPVLAAVGLYYGKQYFQGARCESKKTLKGKTAIITGGNTGIGKETAVDLARRGARVIIACRDINKANVACKEIKARTGGIVLVEELDLASLDSVRKFAGIILKSEPRLDILVNNAGVMACEYQKTQDGFEMQFGVNHMGHFLLTMLLLDLLKRSAPSRIINVSSMAHWAGGTGKINFDDIHFEKYYDKWQAYSHSKLANVLFTRELSKQLEGSRVTVNALHPGAVSTELGRHSFVSSFFMAPIKWYAFKTVEQGAQTSIYCAVSEEMESVSGKYLADCALKEPSKAAQSDEEAKKLWDLSMELVGLNK